MDPVGLKLIFNLSLSVSADTFAIVRVVIAVSVATETIGVEPNQLSGWTSKL